MTAEAPYAELWATGVLAVGLLGGFMYLAFRGQSPSDPYHGHHRKGLHFTCPTCGTHTCNAKIFPVIPIWDLSQFGTVDKYRAGTEYAVHGACEHRFQGCSYRITVDRDGSPFLLEVL